ncbi:helix-turn-helix domain-containing protein [Lactobacillus intestinalis]|uniref:helix-turn-helix domain-containing protein n=1 Tax=Lactobacillus intestinalis TaxID=151781 RepID=UPI0026EB06BE|nr:helix-turn-helix domain-containing protein [Lactobacillus intestinalis]
MIDQFKGSRYFLNVPAEVAHDPRLKDKSKLVFGEIYSMLNVTGAFYMSNQKLAERLGKKTTKPIKDALNELESYGYINREKIYDPENGALIGRQITSDWRPGITPRVQMEPSLGSKQNHPLGPNGTTPRVEKEPLIDHINRTDKYIEEEEEEINKENSLKKKLLEEIKRFAKIIPPENEWYTIRTLSNRMSYESLRRVVLNFNGAIHDGRGTIAKPYRYVIQMMRDELENQKLR